MSLGIMKQQKTFSSSLHIYIYIFFVLQSVKIRNFTSDFADGLAFCAIIHHYFPDEFDFNTLNRDNKQKNFDLAFRIAE